MPEKDIPLYMGDDEEFDDPDFQDEQEEDKGKKPDDSVETSLFRDDSRKLFKVLGGVAGIILFFLLISSLFKRCGSGYVEQELLIDSLEQQTQVIPQPKEDYPPAVQQVPVFDTLYYRKYEGNVQKTIAKVSITPSGVTIYDGDIEITGNSPIIVRRNGRLLQVSIDGYTYSRIPFTETSKSEVPQEEYVQKCRIANYVVQRGDTVKGILRKFGMTRSRLHSLNKKYNLLHGSYLWEGQILKVEICTQ